MGVLPTADDRAVVDVPRRCREIWTHHPTQKYFEDLRDTDAYLISLTLLCRLYGGLNATTGDAFKELLEDWSDRPKTKTLLGLLHERGLVRHDGHICPLMRPEVGRQTEVPRKYIAECQERTPSFIERNRWTKRSFFAVSPSLEEYLNEVLFEPLRTESPLLRDYKNHELAAVGLGVGSVWKFVSKTVGNECGGKTGREQLRDDLSAHIGLCLFGGPREFAELGWLLGERPAQISEMVKVLQEYGLVEVKFKLVCPTAKLQRLMVDLVVPKTKQVIALDKELLHENANDTGGDLGCSDDSWRLGDGVQPPGASG